MDDLGMENARPKMLWNWYVHKCYNSLPPISPCKKNWLIKKARKIFSNNFEKVLSNTSLMKKRGAVVIYFLFNRSSKVQNIHIIIMSRVGQKCRFQNQFSTCLSSCTVTNFHTTTCQIIFYYSLQQEHNGKIHTYTVYISKNIKFKKDSDLHLFHMHLI